MYEPKDVVTSEAEIRDVLPGTIERQVRKVIDHIDDHVRVWIDRSPFVTMATYDATGMVDVSRAGGGGVLPLRQGGEPRRPVGAGQGAAGGRSADLWPCPERPRCSRHALG